MDHFWLALCWLGYFIFHSILALASFKNYFYSVGIGAQWYRFIYVTIATVTLVLILLFSSTIESPNVFYPNDFLKIIGLSLSGMGVVICKFAFKSYNTKAFFGLGSLKPEDEFTTDGLLSKVRHPLYAGSILVLIGYFLFSPRLTSTISVAMMIIYILIGIQLEEKKLEKLFGSRYTDYKNKTPMLVPRNWRKQKKIP